MNKKTIPQLFLNRISVKPEAIAIGWIYKNELKTYRYQQYQDLVSSIALKLKKLGLSKGDKIALLANTSKEWHLIDIASMSIGLTVIPIYQTYLESEICYILQHSESKAVFLDTKSQFKKILNIKNDIKTVKHLITLEEIEHYEGLDLQHTLFSKLTQNDNDKKETFKEFEELAKSINEEDLATIIYTSGTTGEPKGAVITHKAFSSMLLNIKSSLGATFGNEDRNLCFLPLSHVFGRTDSLLHIPFGMEIIYAESIDNIIKNLNLVKPTLMLAVPRIFEKFYAKVVESFDNGPVVKKKLFEWAMKVSNQYFLKIEKDLAPTSMEIVQKNLAYKLVFSKVYEKFGDKIRFFISGGAPLSIDIIKFLRNANLTVLEGYGLTETIAPCTINPASKQVPGTVGVPIGDVEIRFAEEDNEILIRTDALLSSYFKNPEATNLAIDEDGWFYTGDIGRLNSQGYLQITDRKKDIIITAGGKNIAPQKIENIMKLKKYISHAMIVGDKRKYLVAVIGIEKEGLREELIKLEIDPNEDIANISKNSKFKAVINAQLKEVNAQLAPFETIKKTFIAPSEFSVETGELTPSLKLKKKILLDRYKKEIDAMY